MMTDYQELARNIMQTSMLFLFLSVAAVKLTPECVRDEVKYVEIASIVVSFVAWLVSTLFFIWI